MKENSIRNTLKTYLEGHEGITTKQAIEYIQNECGFDTSKEYIKSSFYNLREELHYEKMRKEKSKDLENAIKKYVLEHNNYVSNEEVVKYILQEYKMERKKASIKRKLYTVLKETGGKLRENKRVTLKQIICQYVLEHNNYVSENEVVEYVLNLGIKTTKDSIRITLRNVLKETEGKIKKEKRVSLKQIIYQYVLEHNNYVSRSEVVEYVFSLGIETTKNSIWATLRRVLDETGGDMKTNYKRKK